MISLFKHFHADPKAPQSEPEYEAPHEAEFLQVAGSDHPWLFNKTEMEALQNVIDGADQGQRQWTLKDAVIEPYADRLLVKGGVHDLYVRKSFVLADAAPVYRLNRDGSLMETVHFDKVLHEVKQHIDVSAKLDDAMNRMCQQLTPAALEM